MNKSIARFLGFVALFAASVASAQTYYSYPTTYSSTVCTTLTTDLAQGSRGSEVAKLQQFLVAQNYPGSGSWMVTGYFGQATKQALILFQQSVGLPATGAVDAATRTAIQNRSCGSLYGVFSYPYSQSYAYPSLYNYPYNYSYYGNVSIQSLSPVSAQAGSIVTIYGTGFDAYGNTVYVGGMTANASVSGANTLTFTVPGLPTGTYNVYVSNSRGNSNTLSLSVTATPSVCSGWNFGWGLWHPYQWWNLCGAYSNVTLDHLSPNWTGVGSSVTIHGRGFSSTGNTIYFGNGIINNVSSSNGTTLTFVVPKEIQTPYGLQQILPGDYPVRVVNATGAQSNSLLLSITSQGANYPAIMSVTGPTALAAGVQGTWSVVVSAPYGSYLTTTVHWGDSSAPYFANTAPIYVVGTQTLTFTHSYAQSGTYTITFSVSSGTNSNSATASVVVSQSGSGGTGTVNLSSISPVQGGIGTTVILQGQGFTASDNVVHFGVGGSRNVASYNNGTTISYVIPSYVSPCDLIGTGYVCGAPVSSVTPGVYPIYVTNGNGATNVINFTVL